MALNANCGACGSEGQQRLAVLSAQDIRKCPFGPSPRTPGFAPQWRKDVSLLSLCFRISQRDLFAWILFCSHFTPHLLLSCGIKRLHLPPKTEGGYVLFTVSSRLLRRQVLNLLRASAGCSYPHVLHVHDVVPRHRCLQSRANAALLFPAQRPEKYGGISYLSSSRTLQPSTSAAAFLSCKLLLQRNRRMQRWLRFVGAAIGSPRKSAVS